MSESSDYSPSDWVGHDFTAARKTYDVHVGRSYAAAKEDNKRAKDLVPSMLKTNSPCPLTIVCDVTGSMGNWPATIFSKLPYLDNECKEYLGDDMEVSFAANGDVNDTYPLQVRPFAKGRDLETQLKELVIESGGSGPESAHEAYELTALYYARNVETKEAERPILIFIGDEHFHETISVSNAKLANVVLKEDISSQEVFEELREKFAVYLIRKPYSGLDKAIEKQWSNALGDDHIAALPSADRVVDVIFGILAKETNKVDYFHKEIEERQRQDQVDTVYKSLKTIHAIPSSIPETKDGKSIMLKTLKGKPTKHLI